MQGRRQGKANASGAAQKAGFRFFAGRFRAEAIGIPTMSRTISNEGVEYNDAAYQWVEQVCKKE